MTDARRYYALLGVASTATPAEIRRAFNARAKELHPDTGETGDSAAFQAVCEAYRVLGNRRRRANYDHRGDRLCWEEQTLEWVARPDPAPLRQSRQSRWPALAILLLVAYAALLGVARLAGTNKNARPATATFQSAEPAAPPALSPQDVEADADAAEALATASPPEEAPAHHRLRRASRPVRFTQQGAAAATSGRLAATSRP